MPGSRTYRPRVWRPHSVFTVPLQRSAAGMELLRRGSRLSVTPVTAAEFRTIVRLATAG